MKENFFALMLTVLKPACLCFDNLELYDQQDKLFSLCSVSVKGARSSNEVVILTVHDLGCDRKSSYFLSIYLVMQNPVSVDILFCYDPT